MEIRNDPETSAYHEGAHAVAEALFGVLDYTTIERDQRSTGRTELLPGLEERLKGLALLSESGKHARAQLSLIYMAGPAAERRLRSPREWSRVLAWEGRNDWDETWDWMRPLGGDPAERESIVCSIVDAFVETTWAAIERVARALMERKTLTAAEVLEVMGDAAPDYMETVNLLSEKWNLPPLTAPLDLRTVSD